MAASIVIKLYYPDDCDMLALQGDEVLLTIEDSVGTLLFQAKTNRDELREEIFDYWGYWPGR